MATERTWTVRDWNCETQSYDAPRQVTIEQFMAEHADKVAKAREIYARSVASLSR